MRVRLPLPILAALLIAACGAGGAPPASDAGDSVACSAPRPEACTREYRPVCGERDTGIRCVTAPCDGAWEERTYSNACTACSHEDVRGWRPGACAAGGRGDG